MQLRRLTEVGRSGWTDGAFVKWSCLMRFQGTRRTALLEHLQVHGIPIARVLATTMAIVVMVPLHDRVKSSPDSSPLPLPRTRFDIGVRNAHAMAFDSFRDVNVLFGGADASEVRNDTWAWSGNTRRWSLVSDGGPPPRTFPAMAFDRERREFVLFGGNRVLFGEPHEWDTLLDDTWVLRGTTWIRRSPTRNPVARAEAAMAYDAARRRIVLFGGYSRTAQGRVRLGDTWEWDGEQWSLAATDGPAPRNGAAMVFDPSCRCVVLSGGPPAFVDARTWHWDGRSWRVYGSVHPPARFNPAMIYHDALNAIVRFGGWTGRARAGDTWIRLQGEWREAADHGPSARNHSSMSYDSSRGRAVLFGGHDGEFVFGDTWEFDGSAWHLLSGTAPQRRVQNNH